MLTQRNEETLTSTNSILYLKINVWNNKSYLQFSNIAVLGLTRRKQAERIIIPSQSLAKI